ncbi:MAG: prephenate dehydratase domain-containing protein [Gemmatimonadota bacterium]
MGSTHATGPASPETGPFSWSSFLVRVAIQGEAGSFSDAAARRMLPESELVCCDTFEHAAARVAAGDAAYAVLPVENALAGEVLDVSALMARHGLHAVAELVVPIRQSLIAADGTALDAVREVRSHPVALAQCRRFFEERPRIRAVETADTAGAVREVCSVGGGDLAAIGPAAAAELHGGRVLVEDVSDRTDNRTRFVLIEPRRS